jgi:hypothetical protein
MNTINVLLMNDDKTMSLVISFFGFTIENIEKYIHETYSESHQPYAKKWTHMKYI